jgi:subtilisin family serine protease
MSYWQTRFIILAHIDLEDIFMKHKLFNILMVLVLTLTLTSAGLAQEGGLEVVGAPQADSTYSSDVAKAAPNAAPTLRAPQTTLEATDFRLVSVIVTFDETIDASTIEAATGGTVTHTYKKIFNGASVVLPGASVADLAQLDGVTGIYLDELMQPDTDNSPTFIGAPTVWEALGGQESAGEGVTVGILDTGIWPEHPSFSDPDPSGKTYAAPLVVPGSNGFAGGTPRDTCNFGNTAYNPMDAPFECNNKLIAAYEFLDTYKAVNSLPADGFDSARDNTGHGTHTAGTSAGNANVDAVVLGVNRGKISGIAPRAHVIAYRVCADVGCYSSDSAAAVEQAILDEVDAINFSISGGSNPYSDVVSIAFRSAYENGVFVAASAGNSGPGAETVAHREPWVTTVAASTQDRAFEATATVTGSGGATLSLTGASITDGVFTPAEVVIAPDTYCFGPFAPGQFAGQIVVCSRGTTGRAQKGYEVFQGDAVGMILYNQSTAVTDLETDSHYLPTVHIQYTQGQALLAFLAANPGATATMTAGVPAAAQGDVMASFSSRGGPGQSLGISKPDITAPGVQILAGNTGYSTDISYGPDGNLFQAIAGTSMSSPHIAGSAALLKALHPDWTPGQIKSALMTTANSKVVKEDGVTPATPFDTGSGRVFLKLAGNPGLTFDETAANYVALQSELWNANYPSLYVPVMPGMITVQRTVHSVLPMASTWRLYSSVPADLKVTTPASITVAAGGNATFSITVDASKVPLGEVRHATLILASDGLKVRFPITIVRKQPVVTLSKSCDPTTFPYKTSTQCTITAANTGFADAFVDLVDVLPTGMFVLPGSLSGATMPSGNTIAWNGTLAGAEPPVVTVAPGVSPAGGYLPLSLFGIAPVAGVGDETISNFNIPGFEFAGVTNTRVGMVSNGYLVVGGGTAADVQFINQNLPDPTRPNNVLAPFWSDLNPAFGGAMRVGILTDGVNSWVIFDWEDVANYSDRLPNDFQVWIGINGEEDITFAFGEVSAGDMGFLTVGAENSFGNSGQNFYVDGVGTPPGPDVGVRVSSLPSTPGETHTITFTAKVVKPATYTNCAKMTSDLFQGVNVACTTVTATR